MTPEVHWPALALRLILTVVAGTLLGMERSKTGHVAGLRTTLLVTLAASIAMIQMNLLIPTNGKPHDSYAVMDLMRLPLGILTGVGFIGAGAIVRKGDMVVGITTAATMWFATVVGLCMGGGQIVLGSASTAIGLVVLHGLRRFETSIERYQRAELRLTVAGSELSAEELRARLEAAKFHISALSVMNLVEMHRLQFACELRWPVNEDRRADPPPILHELGQLPGLTALEWKSIATGPG
jgi:putative Mg2+ transporter-C (MgtC) family protein